MKLTIFFTLIIGIFVLTMSGCATIVRGSSQIIPVTSEPTGASVNISGGQFYQQSSYGTTPTQLNLQRKYSYTVTISKSGYYDESVNITPVMDGAIAGNIIFGGLIGGAVDASSGASNTLVPKQVFVKLKKIMNDENKLSNDRGDLPKSIIQDSKEYIVNVTAEQKKKIIKAYIYQYIEKDKEPVFVLSSQIIQDSSEFIFATDKLLGLNLIHVRFRDEYGAIVYSQNIELGECSALQTLKIIVK